MSTEAPRSGPHQDPSADQPAPGPPPSGPAKAPGRGSKRSAARPHCEDHRIYSPKCGPCQAAGGQGGSDLRVIDDPLRTDSNWRRMTEIARRVPHSPATRRPPADPGRATHDEHGGVSDEGGRRGTG